MKAQDLPAGEITLLLAQWRGGDATALVQIINLVYSDLRRLAGAIFKGERVDHTLQPTALVHEVYLQLLSVSPNFQDRGHFLSCACLIMRRLLMKHARALKALKRDGSKTELECEPAVLPDLDSLLAVSGALDQLETMDPRLSQIIQMRFFLGLTIDEIADYLGLSSRTVKREWLVAKSWLVRHLGEKVQAPGGNRWSPGPS